MSKRPRLPHWSDPPFPRRPVGWGYASAPSKTSNSTTPEARLKSTAKDAAATSKAGSPATSAPTKQAAKKAKPRPKPKQWQPPIRHQMILAILRRLYPNAHSAEDVLGPVGGINQLEHQVGKNWRQECEQRGVDYDAPSWDTIKRALKRLR